MKSTKKSATILKANNQINKKEITVRVVNPPTEEEAKEKIKKITQAIQIIYSTC